MRSLIQAFLVFLIMVKLVIGSLFVYQIELSSMFMEPVAMASEAANGEGVPTEVAEKKPDPAMSDPASKDMDGVTKEEKGTDLLLLRKKQEELEEKQRRLEKKERQLVALQAEITDKVETLSRLRDEIRAEISKKKTDEEQKIKHLIKIYSAMKPVKAAGLLEKIDIKVAIELLSKMKGDTVGSILSFVDVGTAARISEGLLKK